MWAEVKAQVDRYPHSQVQTFNLEAAAVQYRPSLSFAIDPVDGGTEDVLASLTEAVLGAGTAGTRAVDASWQKRAKTAMIGVKTAADHGLAVKELAEVMEPVLEQMENNVRNTLDVLCWDEDQVEAYLVSGRLPLLSRWMVQLYHELLLNVVQGVSKHGWDLA
jgi:hypothetical protein